jgi:hypothetical protein
MRKEKYVSPEQVKALLETLKTRFELNMNRHEGLEWSSVQLKIESQAEKVWSLQEMEATGGEPDVVALQVEVSSKNANVLLFYDCAKESPKGRRSICYDEEALKARTKFPPKNSAMGLAAEMGINVLTEEQYRELQRFGNFDTKTSSWILTPTAVRELGGAIFGDFRYGQVFTYHNGAESYYGARAFRGCLKV